MGTAPLMVDIFPGIKAFLSKAAISQQLI